jgi:ribosomal-protein-alanine N-acetyltransferase
MICIVTPDQKDIIGQIIKLEAEAFGDGGLDEWNLVPLIRHGRVFCIVEDDTVLGCIQYMLDWNDHTKAYAVGISIARSQRGKGYGTLLFGGSMDILAQEGIKTVELTVDPENTAAVSVYGRKLGFVITEQRSGEYGKGIDRIAMEKKLTSE